MPTVPLVVGADPRACADPVRAYAALYVGGMGSREQNFYNALAVRMGFGEAAATVQDLFLSGRHRDAQAAVPYEFLDQTSLLGDRARIADRLRVLAERGVTTCSVVPVRRLGGGEAQRHDHCRRGARVGRDWSLRRRRNRQTEPMPTVASRPTWWPRFSSTLRSTALTARLGLALGIAFGVCFLTGLLSYYQYSPWSLAADTDRTGVGLPADPGHPRDHGDRQHPVDPRQAVVGLPEPVPLAAVPVGEADIERVTLALLVAASLIQLLTGFFNVLGWYPVSVGLHRGPLRARVRRDRLGAAARRDQAAGHQLRLRAKLPAADVLTEIPWNENPDSHSNAGERPAPPTPAISRRGVLAAAGAGVGIVVVGVAGQTVTALEPLGLLAPRQPSRGPLVCRSARRPRRPR